MKPIEPEVDLCAALRQQTGAGTFEAHVSVDAAPPAECERFRALCAELGVKCVLIELPEGQTRSQSMTASYHHGSLADVAEEVAALSRRIRAAGFPIRRVKLEAVATNDGVPDTDAQAALFPPSNYFEFHVKLLLTATADLARLGELCARHDAHLSRNALKRDAAGRSERFATLRVYRAGRQRAFAHFDAFLADLEAAGYVFTNKLREYAIYDTAVALDAGWIDVPESGDEHA